MHPINIYRWYQRDIKRQLIQETLWEIDQLLLIGLWTLLVEKEGTPNWGVEDKEIRIKIKD